MHVFYVQGGGLGHLTRIDKLINTLNIPKNNVLIITPSAFTNYFKDYNFVKLLWSSSSQQWTNTIINTIKNSKISMFYVDAFPLGLKNELTNVYSTFPSLKTIYIARILKWETYLKAMVLKPNIMFFKTLVLEQLYTKHLDWIKAHSTNVVPQSLINNSFSPIAFMDTPYIMVVHSGGLNDVLKICNKAINSIKTEGFEHCTIVVFTQVNLELDNNNVTVCKNVFPVSKYYKHALKIYTAAGFNSIQELKPYNSKHVVLPLDKLYDDQFFRVLHTNAIT